MQSQARTVTDYLNEVPRERQEALTRLRQLCLEVLSDYEEAMTYGMPGYKRTEASEPEICFASQKNYISLYVLKQEVMQANRHLLQGVSLGKGCIRYSKPEKIDFEVVKKLLLESRMSKDVIC